MKVRSARLKQVVSFWLIVTIILAHASTINAAYPPETTPGTITTVPSVPMPDYRTPMIEPTFNTTITRITDQAGLGLQAQHLRHGYAKEQVWNADGSRMLLKYSSFPNALIDGNTYEFVDWVHTPSQGNWSHTNPKLIYGTSGILTQNYQGGNYGLNSFVSVDVTTDQWTLIRKFTSCDSITVGDGEGNLSNDDRYVALMCRQGANASVIIFDIPNNLIVSTMALPANPDWVSMSQSGEYVVINWNPSVGTSRYQGVEVFDRSMNFLRQISTFGGHGDLGYDTNGHEVFVHQATSGYGSPDEGIGSYRLDGGGMTIVLNRSTHPIGGAHISCRNTLRPGWCYVSDNDDVGTSFKFERNEVFALKLDGSETIERFAHSRTSGASVTGYEGQLMASPNRNGTKVVFASDWLEGGGYNQMLKAEAASTTAVTGAVQTIPFNRTVGALTMRGRSKAQGVSGVPDANYSLSYKIKYTDGTSYQSPSLNFDTGTHDWQFLYTATPYTPTKPVESIELHAAFDQHSGTVWFDDLVLLEGDEGENLLSNAGFQDGSGTFLSDWSSRGSGYSVDSGGPIVYAYVAEKKGDQQVLRMQAETETELYFAKQTVPFNRKTGVITITGKSKAENVSGSASANYSIYADVNYADGTNLFEQTANFTTGTHDWEESSFTFTPDPDKVVEAIQLYVVLRNKSGTVWFDDVSLSENGGANLLTNAGFQSGTNVPIAGWGTAAGNEYGLDQSSQVVKMSDSVTSGNHYIVQAVNLNRAVSKLTLSGVSKADNVNGIKDSDYSLQADVLYTDGTYLHHSIPYEVGTHDWALASADIYPTKPVQTVYVYAIFRSKSGTVMFEDLRLTENDKEQNLLNNPGFDSGTSIPLPGWEAWSTGYTLGKL